MLNNNNAKIKNSVFLPVSASQMSAWPLQLQGTQKAKGPPFGGRDDILGRKIRKIALRSLEDNYTARPSRPTRQLHHDEQYPV